MEARLVDPKVKAQDTSCIVKDANGRIIAMYLSEHIDPETGKLVEDRLHVSLNYFEYLTVSL